MNCCGFQEGDQAIALDIIKIEAKQYAVEQQKTIAIYKENGELRFCDATEAGERELDVIEMVSKNI